MIILIGEPTTTLGDLLERNKYFSLGDGDYSKEGKTYHVTRWTCRHGKLTVQLEEVEDGI